MGTKPFPLGHISVNSADFRRDKGEIKLKKKTNQYLPLVCFKFSFAFSDSETLRQILPSNSDKKIQYNLKNYRLGVNKPNDFRSIIYKNPC